MAFFLPPLLWKLPPYLPWGPFSLLVLLPLVWGINCFFAPLFRVPPSPTPLLFTPFFFFFFLFPLVMASPALEEIPFFESEIPQLARLSQRFRLHQPFIAPDVLRVEVSDLIAAAVPPSLEGLDFVFWCWLSSVSL